MSSFVTPYADRDQWIFTFPCSIGKDGRRSGRSLQNN